jgi:predicted Zn-dependent peptidase
MSVNRTIQPSIREIESFNITKAPSKILPNGIPLYYLNTGSSEMIKVEWMFEAGNWYQSESLVAFAVNNMLMEGSAKYTSSQIAEMIEFYGGYLGYNVDKDNAYVSLMCMRKYLPQVLEIAEDILKNPTFPPHELDIFKNKHKQQFQVEQTKLKNIARVIHSRMLFGNAHPYGYVVDENDFDHLTCELLHQFHKRFYQARFCKIIVSGKVEDPEIKILDKYFGGADWGLAETPEIPVRAIQTETEKKVFIEKNDAVQSAVRIGKILVNKDHPDYVGLTVLNCILGGYFGSRLMKQIREEKGYTYGINSLFITFTHAGYMTIVSELGTSVTREAVDAIYEEISKLRNELVSDEELLRVKNYMLGEMVRMFDGPFAQAESLISLLEYDLQYDHFDEIIQIIKSITSEEILSLAKQYFDPASFHEVVVGKME